MPTLALGGATGEVLGGQGVMNVQEGANKLEIVEANLITSHV